MQYKIVSERMPLRHIEVFENSVREEIKSGWKPLGSPFYTEYDVVNQAMIKDDKWEYDIVCMLYDNNNGNVYEKIKKFKGFVNKHLQQGWIPEGPFSIIDNGQGDKYICQTVKRQILG